MHAQQNAKNDRTHPTRRARKTTAGATAEAGRRHKRQTTTATAQKTTALRLWCMHTERKVITRGIDLPVDEIELFELAWDPEALARCRACQRPVETCAPITL